MSNGTENQNHPGDGKASPLPRFPFPGLEPGIELAELSQRGSKKGGTVVTCIDYAPDRVQVTPITDMQAFLGNHREPWVKVRWISMRGLSDMEALRGVAEKYGLHPLAIEDMLSPQRPKLDDFPATSEQHGRLFIVARGLRRVSNRLQSKQISLFLGKSTLVSFEEPGCDLFETIRKRMQKSTSRICKNDASFLLYTMLDVLIDDLFPILEDLARRVDVLEKTLLENPTPQAFHKIRNIKHDLVELRRVVWPMRELILELRRDTHECLSETTLTYIRDVYDHIIVLFELIDSYRDLVSDLLDTYMSAVSQRTNEIVKVLTIISTIFVPLTFVAGVYGMNMPIPENHWEGSYFVFWAFCLTVIFGMLFWFRRLKWI